jgi:hypothetical protein
VHQHLAPVAPKTVCCRFTPFLLRRVPPSISLFDVGHQWISAELLLAHRNGCARSCAMLGRNCQRRRRA